MERTHHSGIQGAAPRDIARSLYKKAWFKGRSVCTELHNDSWIRNIKNIDNSTLLEEIVLLYTTLSSITLTNQKDTITWRWTANGQFSVASAYEC
jgi:hypothetical protein